MGDSGFAIQHFAKTLSFGCFFVALQAAKLKAGRTLNHKYCFSPAVAFISITFDLKWV